MKIWLDDLRDPENFIEDKKYQKNLLWVKNYSSALDVIERNNNKITCIHLDKDFVTRSEKEGRHVFNFIEEMLYSGNLKKLQKIIIHSDNDSAVDSMMTSKDIMKNKYNIDLSRVCYIVKNNENVIKEKDILKEKDDDTYGSPFSNKNRKFKP